MVIINLTPHALVVCGREFPPSGQIARCNQVETAAGDLDGIPLVEVRLGSLTGLPEYRPHVYYITSAIAAQAAWAQCRNDVFCPARLVRDAGGNITGCDALARSPVQACGDDE